MRSNPVLTLNIDGKEIALNAYTWGEARLGSTVQMQDLNLTLQAGVNTGALLQVRGTGHQFPEEVLTLWGHGIANAARWARCSASTTTAS